jgi:hypothetical protein
MLRWQEAAGFAITALVTGAGYFFCWVRSSRTSIEADLAIGSRSSGAVIPSQSFELELPT